MRSPHAFLYRAVRGGLLAAALVGGFQVANAGYAQAIPPAGFSRTGDAWTYRAANANEWLANTVRTNATLNVGGRSITLPAAMRMASNAPRFAAAATFGNPLLLVGVMGLGYLYDRFKNQAKVEFVDGQWVDKEGSATATYSAAGFGPFESCEALGSYLQSRFGGASRYCRVEGNTLGVCESGTDNCAVVDVGSTGGSSTPQPLTQQQFEEKVLPYIEPEDVPKIVPDVPVDLPIINPTPGDFPVPQVRRIPLGDFSPYPAPNSTTSTQYRAPILDIKGSPTQAEPWRVDVQPKDIIKEVPNDQPAPDPLQDPVDVPTNDPNPAPTENKDPGLCERYPDILACQKPELDKPEEAIPKKTENIEFTEMNLWGGGSCPANVSVSVNGQSITALEMSQICGWISTYMQPMVILGASLSAMFILMGSRGSDAL